MNTYIPTANKLTAAIAATLCLVACSSTPHRVDAADNARSRLTQLQADPAHARQVPLEIQDAERAVSAAEVPRKDRAQSEHLVILAERKVDTAWALAESRLLIDQRKALSDERETARLDSRTREADRARADANYARDDASRARDQADSARYATAVAQNDASSARGRANAAEITASDARNQADTARGEADDARLQTRSARSDANSARDLAAAAGADASAARSQADSARRDTASAKAENADLQRQILELNARDTDRGLVVTLGDVLFATGRAELKGSATGHLNRLSGFLNRYPERTVSIEGHTDNVGSADSNVSLSLRRADAVRAYLTSQGVAGSRIHTSGQGEVAPVSSNDSSTGRQQNRRVEVVISNPAPARP